MFDKTTSPRKLFKVNHFWKHHLEMWKEGSKQPKKLMNTLLPHPGTYSLPCKEHQWLAAELPTMWGTGSVPMHTKMTWWRKVNVHKSKMVSLLDKKHNCEWGTQFILHFWADKYNNTLRNLTESTLKKTNACISSNICKSGTPIHSSMQRVIHTWQHAWTLGVDSRLLWTGLLKSRELSRKTPHCLVTSWLKSTS